MRVSLLLFAAASGALAVVGCRADSTAHRERSSAIVATDAADVGIDDVTADGPVPPLTLTTPIDDVVVRTTRAEDVGGVTITSVVVTADGDEVFQVDVVGLPSAKGVEAGLVVDPKSVVLKWRNLTTDFAGEIPMFRELDADVAEPSLESAASGAYFLYRKLPETEGGPVPMNNAGCDTPADPLSCGTAGRCCDVHDQCYFDNGCTAAESWPALRRQIVSLQPLTPCARCNAAVVGCITFAAKAAATSRPPPGKSACCDEGNCGEPTCRMDRDIPNTSASCPCAGTTCYGRCTRVDTLERCDGTTDPVVCGGRTCPDVAPAPRCSGPFSHGYVISVPYCDEAGACAVRNQGIACPPERGCRDTASGARCDVGRGSLVGAGPEPPDCTYYDRITVARHFPGFQNPPLRLDTTLWLCCWRGTTPTLIGGPRRGVCVLPPG